MAFRDMHNELRGWVAKLGLPLSQTFINRALNKIYDENTWSFQLFESAWLTPSLISAGTVTVGVGTPNITFDATARAAITALPAPFFITTFQFRYPPYSLYNLISYNVGTGQAVLDRSWMEPVTGAGLPYNLYQAYYPAPFSDFEGWIAVTDPTNACNLDFWSWKQVDLNERDPQRTVFQNPTKVVPLYTDKRAGSSTLGNMMFELYPHPGAMLPYHLYGKRRGSILVNPTDTVPFPLRESLVINRARVEAFLWKEAQKGQEVKRGSGSDNEFLAKACEASYLEELKEIRKTDRDLVDNFIQKVRRNSPVIGAPFYSAITGNANVGGFR